MSKKKKYSKPELKMVELMAEEAVLAGCKTAVGANKSGTRCRSVAACSNNAQLS